MTPYEERVASATLWAAAALTVGGGMGMVASPHAFAESDSATGRDLWLGALAGLVMFLVCYPLPHLLFGLALRSGTHAKLTATAICTPLWALFFGLIPLVSAITAGWSGVAPVAVVAAAAAGVLDGFVFVAALRGLRRLRRDARHRRPPPAHAAPP